MTPVQTAANSSTFTIPGGDFGPGTVAMVNISATFGTAVTAGNAIIVGVVGRIIEPGLNISQAVTRGTVYSTTSGGSHLARSYSVAITLVDSAGFETLVSPATTVAIASHYRLTASHPNPNISTLPGCAGWNLYVNGGLLRRLR